MAILNNSNAISTSGDYAINNSLRLRSSASAYLNRTPGSAGNRRTWTWSSWVKLGSLSSTKILFSACTAGDSTGLAGLQFTSSNTLQFFLDTGATGYGLITTQVFRDPSAWYHIVAVLDTTQATSTNRMKLYINGSQITAFGTATYPGLNDSYAVNNTQAHNIGRYAIDGTRYFDGYLAEVNLIDGQALTPSSFGETDTTTGSWKPKAYTGTYGTNGFELSFSDIATTSGSNAGLGKDFSGNGNYYNTNNISVTAGVTYDAMIDSPTLTSATVANYATLNPLQSAVAPTAGNLDFSSGAAEVCPKATIQLPLTGKWYWETYCSATGTDNWIGVTLDQSGTTFGAIGYRGYRKTGVKNNGSGDVSYGASWAAGDTLGVAVDMDAGTIVFYKNGTSQGTAFSDLAGIRWTVFVYGYLSAGHQVNFGQRPFSYTPPTGFVRLNTFNLPDSTIKKGNTVMDATLYTGNGYPTSGTQSITNAALFKPDLIWIKRRNVGGSNTLTDSVRGVNSQLFSDQTVAQETNTDAVTAFNSNGFSLGTGTSGTYPSVNTNTGTYVGWQWQAGQGSTSSNTSGTITSTVSVNATAGFSVVTYTGTGSAATIGHGLGVAPRMIIVKGRNATIEWLVYHASLGATQYITLNTTGAAASAASAWNNTSPTSSVFSVLSAGSTNFSGTNYVAYCWAEIAGFSKFGSYTGNGSTDSPFLYLGFRPKFILFKRAVGGVGNWLIYDSSRDTYNQMGNILYPNLSSAEYVDSNKVDFLSNGVKIRSSQTDLNTNGDTYIYAAYAENPFKNALAR
jgi:hypothetical protein